jgi:hypothetical protein
MNPEYRFIISIIIILPILFWMVVRIYARLVLYRELKQGDQERKVIPWFFIEGLIYLFVSFFYIEAISQGFSWPILINLILIVFTGVWCVSLGILSLAGKSKQKLESSNDI